MRSPHSPSWPDQGPSREEPAARCRGRALRVPADAAYLRDIRGVVDEAAVALGFGPTDRHHLAVAVNEAATNAIVHGRPYADGTIVVRIVECREALVCSISDRGRFVAPPARTSALAERGRGFTLMARLTDETQISAGANGTTVRLHKRRPRMREKT